MKDDPDLRQYAPAAERNREPILTVLKRVLPPTGCVLEIASGSGQHAVYCAPRLQPRRWLPSDPSPFARESIQAWIAHCPADNLLPPLNLDAADPTWPDSVQPLVPDITAIVNVNMIHISAWQSCLGLMAGAGRILSPGGVLYLYGPFRRQGQPTAPSNEAFDQRLRSQNPDWGLRHLEDVAAAAIDQQLILKEVIAMPANNLSVVFERI
ncbi:DUF938 domain-containing protein [Pseudanabaena sp. FACHB-2040]|uniref:DUF938 domain-containing protein n=1 Tax=Pseudanabaena sp. FACHB-2040 TaxID=2692859 RepID=UPI0016846800|nr:DUF938 domain-containing protein [Pseudanabaena sp. FACHB-2040]MBD2256590.1 DUF938 domain-containing protein [Pseudanabaena sp. FACHB-2040]